MRRVFRQKRLFVDEADYFEARRGAPATIARERPVTVITGWPCASNAHEFQGRRFQKRPKRAFGAAAAATPSQKDASDE
jgi:hypothetical protein